MSEIGTSSIIETAFENPESHKQIGIALAEFVYTQAQRPGILRTMIFHATKHWVPEFSDHEFRKLQRIKRRQRSYKRGRVRLSMTDREIVRTLRRT